MGPPEPESRRRARRPRARRATTGIARLVGLCLVLGLVLWALMRIAVAPVPARNVLLILVDALRPDHLGCYGYAVPTSPSIDRLASEAVVFDAASSTASQTVPSVLSLWSGLYPSRHGNMYYPTTDSFRVRAPRTPPWVPDDVALLAEYFRGRGFRTGAVVTNPWLRAEFGFARGFDDYAYLTGEGSAPYSRASIVNERAISMLQRWRSDRFFLYVHYMDVHAPYQPPEPYRERFVGNLPGRNFDGRGVAPYVTDIDAAYMRALYDADIRAVDDAVRDLLTELSSLGLDSSTIVVFTADHGEEFLDHERLGHGWTLYEEMTRVPLLIRIPDSGSGGQRIAVSVSLLDLWPTLAELTGGAPPLGGQGVSLVPLINGDRETAPERVLFAELGSGTSARRGTHKLIRWSDPGWQRAYDLSADPGEQHPIEREATWRNDLEQALDHFAAASAQITPRPTPAATLDAETAERLRALGYGP